MKNYVIISLLLAVLVLGCIGSQNQDGASTEKTITIGDIVANPSSYAGRTMALDAKYAGWSSVPNCDTSKIAMKTRSDILIYDDFGCIYVAAGEAEILAGGKKVDLMNKPADGTPVKVTAAVRLIDGKPILSN
jgi:hypothetical protein